MNDVVNSYTHTCLQRLFAFVPMNCFILTIYLFFVNLFFRYWWDLMTAAAWPYKQKANLLEEMVATFPQLKDGEAVQGK